MTQPDDVPVYQPVVTYVPVEPTGSAAPAVPAAPAPDKRTRTSIIVLAAFLLVAVVAGTLVFTLQGSSDRILTIEYGLLDADGGSDCSGGTGGYDDIAPGMPITVSDERGTIIASTSLPYEGKDLGFGCVWTMRVAVPDDVAQYAIEGGRRGVVTFSHQELESEHWKASLSIGD